MPQNGIYHEGIAALTDAFSCNPNLSILNMNDNTFTEKGAKCLAEVLPKLQKLKILNLGDCLLKTEGATLIAKALESGHQVSILSCSITLGWLSYSSNFFSSNSSPLNICTWTPTKLRLREAETLSRPLRPTNQTLRPWRSEQTSLENRAFKN